MKSKLFRTRFILKGIFVPKDQLKYDEIWLIPHKILLKQIGREFSAFVVTEGKENSLEKDIEEEAEKKILPYVRLCSLLTWATPTLQLSGTREIESRDMIGKAPYPVLSTLELRDRMGVSKAFLQASGKLSLQIAKLNQKYSFLETASSYCYSVDVFGSTEDTTGFSGRRFIDAAISLESLFNEFPSDIAYKISMRTALLLGLLDPKSDSNEIFKTMKKLYRIRNDIAHGAAENKKEYTRENLNTIRHYARSSLVCSYILSLNRQDQNAKEMKKNLMDEIDETLLVSSHRIKLGREIARGKKWFTIPNVIKKHT